MIRPDFVVGSSWYELSGELKGGWDEPVEVWGDSEGLWTGDGEDVSKDSKMKADMTLKHFEMMMTDVILENYDHKYYEEALLNDSEMTMTDVTLEN